MLRLRSLSRHLPDPVVRLLPLTRRLAVSTGVLFIILTFIASVLPVLIDTTPYREQVLSRVEELTARKALIKGDVTFRILPRPVLMLQGVELGEPLRADVRPQIRTMQISMIQLNLGWNTLFSKSYENVEVLLRQPTVEMEARFAESTAATHFFTQFLGMMTKDLTDSLALSVEQGSLRFTSEDEQAVLPVEQITAQFNLQKGGGGVVRGGMLYQGRPLMISASSTPVAADTGQGELRLNLGEPERFDITFAGIYKRMEKVPTAAGNFELKVANARKWFASGTRPIERQTMQQRITDLMSQGDAPIKEKAPYPIQMKAKANFDGAVLRLEDMDVQTPDIGGKGSAEWKLIQAAEEVPVAATPVENPDEEMNPAAEGMEVSGEAAEEEEAIAPSMPEAVIPKEPDMEMTVNFSQLNLTQVWDMLRESEASKSGGKASAEALAWRALVQMPQRVRLKMTADSFTLGQRRLNDVGGSLIAGRGDMQVENASFKVAAQSDLNLAGKVVDTSRGVRFEGTVNTKGPNLRETLSSLDELALKLPEKGFGEYAATANLFVSSEQLRLSEAEVELGELKLGGGFVMYFEDRPRIEAEIQLNDTNLDYFRDAWREEAKKRKKGENSTYNIKDLAEWRWLRSLAFTVDLRMHLNNFRFLERQGSRATFRLYAEPGRIGLHDIVLRYPEGDTQASLVFDVKEELPKVELTFSTPEFDTAYFALDPVAASTPQPFNGKAFKWSEELFDLGWMTGLVGKFNLVFSRLIHSGQYYHDVAFKGDLENELFTLEKFECRTLDGDVSVTGRMVGGKVPSVSASFMAYNIDLLELLKAMNLPNKVYGRVSLSGTLTTSGINPLAWLKQADLKMVALGAGVRVDTFNLPAVVDTVLASRRVPDVSENVNRVLSIGRSEFTLEGNLNVADAVMRTPGLKLQTGDITGVMNGEVDLQKWTMNLTSVYRFPSLSKETTPTLTVDLIGPLNNYEMKTDTTSLEGYVAKRIVGE